MKLIYILIAALLIISNVDAAQNQNVGVGDTANTQVDRPFINKAKSFMLEDLNFEFGYKVIVAIDKMLEPVLSIFNN